MRVKITLACSECKQRNYDTKKNKRNDPDRLEMNKYLSTKGVLNAMAEKKAVAKTTDKKAAAKKSDSGKKRFNLVKTFKDMWAELKKVTWPSRKDLIRQSTVVIVFVLILTVVVGLMDYVLSNLLRLIIS